MILGAVLRYSVATWAEPLRHHAPPSRYLIIPRDLTAEPHLRPEDSHWVKKNGKRKEKTHTSHTLNLAPIFIFKIYYISYILLPNASMDVITVKLAAFISH